MKTEAEIKERILSLETIIEKLKTETGIIEEPDLSSGVDAETCIFGLRCVINVLSNLLEGEDNE